MMSGRKQPIGDSTPDNDDAGLGASVVANHFSLFARPTNTSVWLDSLNQLKVRYLTEYHPLHAKLITLIDAAVDFYTQTDSQFSKTRNEYINDSEILDRLNQMANALQNCNENLLSPELSDNERQVLQSALSFCLQSIEMRLNELQNAGDRVYSLYDRQENPLHELMIKSSEASFMPKR